MKVIVIGSGIGGCVLSRELLSTAIDITLIEAGSKNSPSPYNDLDAYNNQDSKLMFTRGMGFGGSTNYWHNGLVRISQNDFLNKNNELDWPMPFSEVAHNYDQAEMLLTNFCKPILKNEFTSFKDDDFIINDSHFGSNSIRYISSPVNAKILVQNQIKIQFDCKQLKLILADKKVVGIEYYQYGVKVNLACDILVLACGGLGSPALLLSEQNKENFKNKNIGKFLQDHISSTPLRVKFKTIKNIKSFYKKESSGFARKGITFYDSKHELNHIAYPRLALSLRESWHSQELKAKLIAFRHAPLNLKDFLQLLANSDLLLESASHKFNLSFPTKILSFNIVSEQENLASRRIEIIDGRLKICWDVSSKERQSILTFCSKIVESLSGEVQSAILSSPESIPFTACAHHSGTMRMSSNAETGVVDVNLKMFGFDNIYVCDGSVLPRTGYANTGLTIASMAIRLSQYIKAL